MCLNHPALVQKHPTHLASSVCTKSGWFKHSEPTRTTPSQSLGTSSGWFKHTSANLHEPHHHRASKVLDPPRTRAEAPYTPC